MYDREKLWDRAGSTELLVRLINKLADIVPRSLEKLDKALAEGDAHALERGAHSLRGSLATFEAPEPVGLARQIEAMALAGELAQVGPTLAELRRSTSELVVQLLELAKDPPV